MITFQSDWSTAIGASKQAITDGGRWPEYSEFNHGDGTQLLAVVEIGGRRALSIKQRGATYAANLMTPTHIPISTDYRVSFDVWNDDRSPEGDHTVTGDYRQYEDLLYLRKFSGADAWRAVMGVYGCGYVWPIGYWWPMTPLAYGRWYTFSYDVHFTSPTTIQAHPKIYNANGTILFDDVRFQQTDPGTPWQGKSDWTLQSYYAAGHDFCVRPEPMTRFAVGNNGQNAAVDTGDYWYIGRVKIETLAPAVPVLTAGTWQLPAGSRIIVP